MPIQKLFSCISDICIVILKEDGKSCDRVNWHTNCEMYKQIK